MPGAPKSEKMKNLVGRGKIRFYPVEQLSYDAIVLCGGEMKAIVTARECNPHGVGAVCMTAGEGNWNAELTNQLRGKTVYVMMDIDAPGEKAAQGHLARIRMVAKWVGWVRLPLDRDKYPKGDVNDFVGQERGDLWSVIQATEQWTPPIASPKTEEGEVAEVPFNETTRSENVGKRLRFTGVVTASIPQSYIVPKTLKVVCDKAQKPCHLCAVFPVDETVFKVDADSPCVMSMIEDTSLKVQEATRAGLGIPKDCPVVEVLVEDHYDVEDVRVSPSLDISNRDTDKTMQRAVCVSCRADLNESFEFEGRLYPHPKTQQATLVISESRATHDALDRYEPTDLEDLREFQPESWDAEGLTRKLDEIHSDMEDNVTHVFFRRDLHLFFDLFMHSCLLLRLEEKRVKGWTELLIVGDSANGKSEVARCLRDHYGLGEIVVCKQATEAGLLGGLNKIGNTWFVTWGALPTHDKRAVILEELKGAKVEVIGALTDCRSSGVAEMHKIEKRRTHARTRLLALSNPRGANRTMDSYSYGVEAVRDLIGSPEDVRRFDAALVTTDADVDPVALADKQRSPARVSHRYTADLCRRLVLWAWTRRDYQVEFEDAALSAARDAAQDMPDRYSAAIPLVDRGSMLAKLCRLSAALACRTFSCSEDLQHTVVRECHVRYVVAALERIYSHKNFGYLYFSEAMQTRQAMVEPETIKLFMESLPYPREVKDNLLSTDTMDLTDIQDWCAWSRDEAHQLMSLLVRKRALRRVGPRYIKTPDFIQWLKQVELVDKPDHVKRDEKERF
jgi:hypothetical protein